MLFFANLLTVMQSLWSLPFLLFLLINYKLCYVHSESKVDDIRKYILISSYIISNRPAGWIFGYWFIGYIYYKNDYRKMYILCNDSFLLDNKLTNKIDEEIEDNKDCDINQIEYYKRGGNYSGIFYDDIIFNIKYSPLKCQEVILDKITDYNKNHCSFTVLITGKPCTGKSMISLLLASKLNYTLVDSFNPTDPGDNIFKLIKQIEPNSNKKIIIVFEEIDILINKIHNGLLNQHKDIPTEILSKREWNMFLDKINRNFYENIILIMTSNKSIDYFNSLDSSYFRKGRLDLNFEMDDEINIDLFDQ